MAGLVPAIHKHRLSSWSGGGAVAILATPRSWMAGTSPAMTLFNKLK
jgi:hypothetical protein